MFGNLRGSETIIICLLKPLEMTSCVGSGSVICSFRDCENGMWSWFAPSSMTEMLPQFLVFLFAHILIKTLEFGTLVGKGTTLFVLATA
ncbi:hypothetical protein LINPERPRIM_LOCUS35751 [Linum perenne]